MGLGGLRHKLSWRELLPYVIPLTLVALLFAGSVFFVFLPKLESEMLAHKKNTMRELTKSAWSILAHAHAQEQAGTLSRLEAQREAIAQIRAIRYGAQEKDYFWINDLQPEMVMHPYRPDLEGQDLRDYTDPDGVHVFEEFVRIVKAQGAGYANYKWQWKDDPERVEPKLSYVKGFEPWGWIVGTGVYLGDVRRELAATRQTLLLACALVLLFGLGLSLFLSQQVRRIQRDRLRTAKAMADQAQFLDTLLSAIPSPVYYKDRDSRYLRCNTAFATLTGVPCEQLVGKTAHEVWQPSYAAFYEDKDKNLFEKPGIQQYEYVLPSKTGQPRDVIFYKSTFQDSSGQIAGIVGIVMDITERKRAERRAHILETAAAASNECEVPEDAYGRVLNTVCTQLDWAAGIVMKPSEDTPGTLAVAQFRSSVSWDSLEELLGLESGAYCAASDGFPGQLFRAQKPAWLCAESARQEPERYPWSHALLESGFQSLLGIPVRIQNEVAALLVFFSHSDEAPGETTMAAMAEVGVQLGRVAERQRKNTEISEREERLRESEETFRALSEESADVIMRFDHAHRHLYVNPAVEAMTGLPAESFIGKTHLELGFPEALSTLWRETIDQVFKTGAVQRVEFQLPNGIWVDWLLAPEFDAKGDVRAVVTSARDITDRKRGEQALRQSEQRYRSLFEASGDAVLVMRGGCFTDANTRAMELLGTCRENIVNRTPADFSPAFQPDGAPSAQKAQENIAQALQGKALMFEWQHQRADGTPFDAEVSLARVELDQEPYILAVVRDITERRRAAAELDKTRSLLTAAVEQSPAGILIADAPDIRIRLANAAALAIRGTAEGELVDIPLDLHFSRWQTYYPDGAAMPPEELPLSRAILHGETIRDLNVVIRRPSGEGRTVSANAAPVRNADGEIVAGVVVFNDMTEHLQLEQQLSQAQKMEAIGQLAGGVAHDFNNLLQAINGYVELGRERVQDDDTLQEYLGEVAKAGMRATALVRQLLAFSRRESLKLEHLDINELVAGLIKMLRRLIGEHIDLGFHPGAELHTVCADAGQIEQILLNLCVNARDAMPTGGRILIETRNVYLDADYVASHPEAHEGTYVVLSVTDTGCGIPPEVRDRIFEPFFSTKGVGEGTGLGLATVYAIAQRHEGFVNLYSELDRGTTFRIYLPVSGEDTSALAEAAGEQTRDCQGSGETVLVAEDDRQVRELVTRMLSQAGYNVLAAKDGLDACAVFEANMDDIEVALLDVVMPKRNGHEVFQVIRAKRPDLPVLFASGYSFDILNAGFLPADEHILVDKPFVRPNLLHALHRALARNLEA